MREHTSRGSSTAVRIGLTYGRRNLKMCCLELFKGTGSIGRAFERLGWAVVSLDKDPKFKPTIAVDILDWDYIQFPCIFVSIRVGEPVLHSLSKGKNSGRARSGWSRQAS